MNTHDLIKKRRAIRAFEQKGIDKKIIMRCIDAARLAPSAVNLQPLEYVVITKGLNKIFKCAKVWAGNVKEFSPKEDERPMAYVIVISNREGHAYSKYDVGLSIENMILAALEEGVSSCILGAIDREKLRELLNIPENYNIELMVAFGYAKHKSFEEEYKGDFKYWMDSDGNFHVPKKSLGSIMHEERF